MARCGEIMRAVFCLPRTKSNNARCFDPYEFSVCVPDILLHEISICVDFPTRTVLCVRCFWPLPQTSKTLKRKPSAMISNKRPSTNLWIPSVRASNKMPSTRASNKWRSKGGLQQMLLMGAFNKGIKQVVSIAPWTVPVAFTSNRYPSGWWHPLATSMALMDPASKACRCLLE